MGSQIRHRMFAIVDRTQMPAHLTVELRRFGVSADGARQLLAGDVVSSFGDRLTLARITQVQGDAAGPQGIRTQVAVDPSDPSGNTIYIGTGGGGVWNVSPLGLLQFFAGLPVTDPLDRQRLAQVFAQALA